jgi:hypothetical protein
MQQILNVRKTLIVGGLLLAMSNAADAASGSYAVTVTTLPDLVLTEIQPLNYGSNMYIDALGVCTMDAGTPTDTLAQIVRTSADSTGAGFGAIVGTGCVTSALDHTKPGIYKIKGLQGQTVNITIGGASDADFSFSPNGCIGTYDGSTTAADTCSAYTGAQSAVTKPLATTADVAGAAVAGELLFTVGGVVTVGSINLIASQAYSQSFPVDVIY